MNRSRLVPAAAGLLALPALLVLASRVPAQDAAPPASIQSVEEDHERQLLALDKQRLARLAALAATQKAEDAAATYERLLRLAIQGDLFVDAEPAALGVIERGTPSPTTEALAHLVKIIAEVQRGAFAQSLQSLRAAVAESRQEQAATRARALLSPAEVIGIIEAYYQRLVEGSQFPIAKDALRLLLEQPYEPGVKEFLASRLKRLELVGKPAPPIRGKDLDGKAFDLAVDQGKVVLLIFWASWNVPSATQVAWLEKLHNAHTRRGLEVVGINVDVHDAGSQKLESALPNIRRFVLDYNIEWPTLLNGTGDLDFARAYGVSDIPANVLIGRDGNVIQVDLSRRNAEAVLGHALAP